MLSVQKNFKQGAGNTHDEKTVSITDINLQGMPRNFVRGARVSPSLKCLVGFNLANVSICATYMVLLAGDIRQNPGPVKDPCLVCSRGCRKTQKTIQCDICDQWFHAKCIGMKALEYNQLCD